MENKDLGSRMKDQYEDRTRILLPRRTYMLIRLDGQAFHTYCRSLKKPFDQAFMDDMESAAKYCCENMQGVSFAFCQSDEVSFLLTDFEQITTEAWFNGDLRKICSISASLMTAKFNQLRKIHMDDHPCILVGCPDFMEGKCQYPGILEGKCRYRDDPTCHFDSRKGYKLATFDSRAWTIPDREEVKNYFIWRQRDATRNSILAVAQSLYSHNEMMNKNVDQLQEMIFQKGQNWNDYPIREKRGTAIIKEKYSVEDAIRHRWVSADPPIFTQEKDFLEKLVPKYE